MATLTMGDGERRLAAIMFTDVVGYTRLAQANESLALELLREHQTLMRPVFAEHDGTEVKTIGDAFLVEFKSALDAVACAADLQRRMGERNARVPPSRRLEVRIGVHVGDVVHVSGDIQGDAVNVASRIQPLAEPGGVCISQQVFDQVRNKVPLGFEKLGEFELKNIDLPIAVYKVALEGGPSTAEPGSKARLAVLPFVSMSPDPNDEYFADGMTEEVIMRLSEMEGLDVIARTSVMSYKKKSKTVSEIASELRVGSIIEGSVRKAGDRVRISIQLVDPRTEARLWSSNYEGRLDDIFAIQRDVAEKVATSLAGTILSAPGRRDTRSIEAYTLYLQARQLDYDLSEEGMRKALDLLRRAISKDPRFARAWASLSGVWHGLGVLGYEDYGEMGKRAEEAAAKALELDPQLAEAHSAMAAVNSMLDRFDSALAEAEEAVRINPNLSDAYMILASLESHTHGAKEAATMYKRAYELDPLSMVAAEMLAAMARWSGDDALADDVLARMKELSPKNAKTYLIIADHLMEKKDFEQAQEMLDLARGADPDEPMTKVSQALLFAMMGKRGAAEAELKKIMETNNEFFKLNGGLVVHAALGDLDEAFEALNKMGEAHSWPAAIKIDPLFAAMRRDPRFAEFCRRVGIKP